MATAGKSRFRSLVIFGAVVGILLVLALLVPFLVDLSSFKPQIQAAVAQNVNARLDFASARLHILPSVGIKLKKVSLENSDPDFNGTKLFDVDDVMVQTKLIPLFGGKIVGNVVITSPQFTLARKGLKNNLAALAKPKEPPPIDPNNPPPATDPAKTDPTTSQTNPVDPAEQAKTMAMIKDKILIEAVIIDHADITIRDLATPDAQMSEPVRVRDLNVKVTNIGLDRDIAIGIETKLDVNEAGARIQGPIRMDQIVRVAMGGTGLEKATFSGKLSYDDLSIEYGEAFKKASGIPLNITFNGTFVPEDFTLENLVLNFHNLKVESMAHVVDFKDPRLSATLKVANENLASLGDVLPKHRDMLINGQLHIDAGVEGKISSLDTMAVRTLLDAKLTGTDFNVNLATTAVLPFKGKLAVKSQRIDLEALLKPFKSPGSEPKPSDATVETSPAPGAPSAGAPATAPTAKPTAKDFELSPELKKMLTGTDGSIQVDLKEMIYSSLNLTNIKLDVHQESLVSSLNQFNIDGFGGKITAKGRINLGESPISFDGDFKMVDIHPEQVMLVIKPEHKDVLVGRMNLDLGVRGRGTTVPTLNRTLNGSGTFKFNEGQLNTPSIASKMQEEFDQYVETLSVSGAGEGIINAAKKLLDHPLAKASGKAPDLDKLKEQYKNLAKVKLGDKASTSKDLKDLSGKLEIKDGKIYILTVRTDNSGTMDIKSFVDLEMNLGGGAVYTASEATKQHLLGQSKYADLIMDEQNNLILNLGLAGTVTAPKVSLSSDSMRASFQKKAQALIEREVKQAADDYIKRLMGGGQAKDEGKAKAQEEAAKREAEAKAKVQEEAKKHEGKAKDALKGLFGK